MILCEWCGLDARYRMAVGNHAQHRLAPGQMWELQRSDDGVFWIAMVDYNAGVRAPEAQAKERAT